MSIRKSFVVVILLLSLAVIVCQDSGTRPSDNISGTVPSDFISTGEYLGEYWPSDFWRECAPEEVGMNSTKLKLAYTYAADPSNNTEGLVIIRDGYIVAEAYFGEYRPSQRHYSFSVAKSFTSAVVGIAIDQGHIPNVAEKVYQYYPQWQTPTTDPRKKMISIEHLLTMTSGIEWNEDVYYGNSSQNDAFIMHRQRDMNQYVLDKPMRENPGERWYYSTGNSQLLSGVIQAATGETVYEYALPNLLRPLGLDDIGWDHDAAGHTHTGAGVRATVREYAKFGYLYYKRGRWDGRQIVSEQWVNRSLQPVSDNVLWYGYHWWLKSSMSGHANSIVPDSTFLAWGIYTQQIFVIPEERIVIARVGSNADPNNSGWSEVTFLTCVLEAVMD